MMKLLNEKDIDYIAIGASLLGSGGGGDPKIGKLLAKNFVRKYGPVELISTDELADEDYVTNVAGIGAPSVLIEKIPSELEMVKPLEAMEDLYSKKVDVVMPIEVGGINSLYPVAAAAKKQIRLLDADTMGRAFPEIQMVSFNLHGLESKNMTMADEKGNSVILKPVDGKWSEYLARALTVEMGGTASMSNYFLTGKQVRNTVIKGTLSLAREIGELILDSGYKGQELFDQLLSKLNGFELFDGKIVDLTNDTVAGFTRGTAKIAGINNYQADDFSIEFQNENLVAKKNDKILSSVPDLIVALDLETAQPITTERLQYGARVKVISIPCDQQWRRAKGIELAGPRYFGYDFDYLPVEDRQEQEV